MVQPVKDPSFGVLEDIVCTTEPAFNNSILTLDPTLPEDVQVIVGMVPMTQDSPPLGEATVIVLVGEPGGALACPELGSIIRDETSTASKSEMFTRHRVLRSVL